MSRAHFAGVFRIVLEIFRGECAIFVAKQGNRIKTFFARLTAA
jgi:hypothetical protein